MFLVQGVSDILRNPEIVRTHEEAYDDLLHDTPGIFWNMYLRGLKNPNRNIHLMHWNGQDASEVFGVSPGFQAMRRDMATSGGPLGAMAGPLSPGYWEPVFERTITSPATGRDPSTLGFARHAMIFVRPGQEQTVEGALRTATDTLPAGDAFTARLFRSLGQPNVYTFVAHTRTEEAARALQLPAEQIDSSTDDIYRVVLSSDWPGNRT